MWDTRPRLSGGRVKTDVMSVSREGHMAAMWIDRSTSSHRHMEQCDGRDTCMTSHPADAQENELIAYFAYCIRGNVIVWYD